ncbi:hypothetical protein MD484_g3228, partial [Candolleomyces efflorescens]
MGASSKLSSGALRHSSATRPAPRPINTPRPQEQLPADRRALEERLDRIEAREAAITSKVESIETGNSLRDQKQGELARKLDNTERDLKQEIGGELKSGESCLLFRQTGNLSPANYHPAFDLQRQDHAQELRKLSEAVVLQEVKSNQVEDGVRSNGHETSGKVSSLEDAPLKDKPREHAPLISLERQGKPRQEPKISFPHLRCDWPLSDRNQS